jgi:squalene synthase HpnC
MSIDPNRNARQGYRWCREFSRRHYENFPVASLLLPGNLRDPVAAVYSFARTADDIADEGNLEASQRLAALDAMHSALHRAGGGEPPDELMYHAIADTLQRHQLPLEPFEDLLSAFRQDVTKRRYENFGELMDYCRRSANPIGRLMLHLQKQDSERNLAMSDAICSALQLINFLQDISQDYTENKRIYLPQDELQRFQVKESDIADQHNSPAVRALLIFQIQRAGKLLRSGSPLGMTLPGRFGLEVRAIVLGGSRILEKLYRRDNPFTRPRLDRTDRLKIVWGALLKGFP